MLHTQIARAVKPAMQPRLKRLWRRRVSVKYGSFSDGNGNRILSDRNPRHTESGGHTQAHGE